MKRVKIVAVMMVAAAVLPAYSQENIKRMFDKMQNMQGLIVSEEHYNDHAEKKGGVASRTDVYYFKLPADTHEAETDTPTVGELREAFAKDRSDATREFSRSAEISMDPPRQIKIVSQAVSDIILGKHPQSSYVLMVFPDSADDSGNRRYAYAMEWMPEKDGSIEIKLVFDSGNLPKATPNGDDANRINRIVKWVEDFRFQIFNLRPYIKEINKGSITNFPMGLYKLSLNCPISDKKERTGYAEEIRRIADEINVTSEQNILYNAAKKLEQ